MELSVNQWDIVIKVKYGDSLRRFSAHVAGDSLNHNMNTLRTKVIDLFKFNEDADLLFTYIDIDGDVVTLSNDEELHDAVIHQRLNPLRIDVLVNNENTAANNPSNNAATNATRQVPTGLDFLPPQVSFAVEESLRSVPEPLRITLTKISEEVSKVATATPVVSELVDFLSKLGQSPFAPLYGGIPGSGSVPQQGANNSGGPHAPQDILSVPPTADLVDLTLDEEQPKTGNEFKIQNDRDKGKKVAASASFSVPVHDGNIGLQVEPTSVMHMPGGDLGGNNKKQSEGHVPSSNFQYNTGNGNMDTEQPNSTPIGYHSGNQHCPAELSRRGSFGLHDGLFQAFHRGVTCDGCGMHPIMGPRFKSKVQENYDLCNICFSEIGHEPDFIRIDRPLYRPPKPFRGGFFGPHSSHHGFRGWGMRHPREKLESRFIQDVTILDGTLVAPSTPFTKIWRMRNSGLIPWPRGTHLLWIGGDLFADKNSVDLEIPPTGFPSGEEIDVAVDFQAPTMPGRYVSYWRLASPHGQKFGQRVWVLIQVENFGPTWQAGGVTFSPTAPQGGHDAGGDDFEPMEDVQHSTPDPPRVNVEPVKPSSDGNSGRQTDSTERSFSDAVHAPSKPAIPEMDLSSLFPAVVPPPVSSNSTGIPVSFVPYPTISMPMPSSAPPEVSLLSYPTIDSTLTSLSNPPVASVTPTGAILDEATEQALLRELEEIGFKEVELNKEILRKNEYDLEQSVDDLCNIADWNPLLEELQEMGFYDKEKNIKLLSKNAGSLKRTVLDLISVGKPE